MEGRWRAGEREGLGGPEVSLDKSRLWQCGYRQHGGSLSTVSASTNEQGILYLPTVAGKANSG